MSNLPFSRILKHSKPSVIIASLVVIFLCIALINQQLLSRFRIDMTEHNTYTLSDGTVNILKSIEEPMHMRFFYSKELASAIPTVNTYGQRIAGLLEEYDRIGGSNITLTNIDPEPFSKEEDQAVDYGIKAIPVSDSGQKLYFGLAISNSTDELQTITFFDPDREAFLEYDLTQAIYKLNNPKLPKLGILSWVDFEQPKQYAFMGNQDDWTIIKQLKEQYDVTMLDTSITTIGNEFDLLLIIHPTDLSADTAYAIDQYVVGGGSTMVFVDPYLELPGISEQTSNLQQLFTHWGVDYNPNNVVLDGINGLRIPNSDQSATLKHITKLNWLGFINEYFNQDEITTGELASMNMISSGAISLNNTSNLTLTPLIQTSKQAMVVDKIAIHDPQSLIENFQTTSQFYTVAGRISGNFTSAFESRNNQEGHIAAASKTGHVIITADADMLRDQFWLRKQPFYGQMLHVKIADNSAYVINNIDQLTGSTDLIGLRSRNLSDRPFVVVRNIKREAEKRFLEKERILKAQLAATEQKLFNLQQQRNDANQVILNAEQEAEIDQFKIQMLETRQELRNVQHNLRQEITSLGSTLKIIHIILLPIIIVLLSLIVPKQLGIRRT